MTQQKRLLDWVQPHLLDAPPYTPILPPRVLAQRIGVPPERIIKLDGNENPYGASPKTLAALAAGPDIHIYPDPQQTEVRAALGRYIGYEPEWVVGGAGSDELIDLLVRLFVPPGEAIVNFPPTFGMYAFLADVQGARVVNVTRRADYSLELDAAVMAAGEARLVFAVSPNNPSGTLLRRDELEALLETGRPVVLDEAYAEFAGETYVDLVRSRPNLVVLRTMSKWAGLAGLRVGYMVADPALVELVLRLKQPYNINVAAEVATLASLEDVALLRQRVDAIVFERERMAALLGELPGFEVTPSRANFLLCRLSGVSATDVQAALADRGILVRHFDTPLLDNHLRFSIGRPDQTDAVLTALREILDSLRVTRTQVAL